jgi:hypothetical protein
MNIPIETVDSIFEHFSKYGKNWTQQQIIDEFNLNWKAWSLLKSRLNLNKYSHVLSDYTLNKLSQQ